MNEEQQQLVRQIVRDELQEFLASDRYIFHKLVQFLDGRNIQIGRANGSQIGTATDQKIAFHGATPVIQSASANQAQLSLTLDVTGGDTVNITNVNANFTNIQTLLNQLRSDLINKGLIKGSA